MKISRDFPPNISELKKHFDIDESRTLFTYGDTIYNPGGINIDECLMAHEKTHIEQQENLGPERWWHDYISMEIFRLHQEAWAYARQFDEYCRQEHDRNKRYRYLRIISSYLASDMYKLGRTQLEARYAIEQFIGA